MEDELITKLTNLGVDPGQQPDIESMWALESATFNTESSKPATFNTESSKPATFNTESSKPATFNTGPIDPEIQVIFMTPDSEYLELPKKWYEKSRYVARCAVLMTGENQPPGGDPENDRGVYLVCLSANDDLNYRMLHRNSGPTTLPELYEYYEIFMLYDFDTQYVGECLFFQLFVHQHREHPILHNITRIEYLFNIANLLSSEKHKKMYKYPAMTGEYYVEDPTGTNVPPFDMLDEDEARKAFEKKAEADEHLDIEDELENCPRYGAPNWREYTNFIRELRDTPKSGTDRATQADEFFQRFLGDEYKFHTIPVTGNELLPLIMRDIKSPVDPTANNDRDIHLWLMSNYETFHFYLSDPVLFGYIRTPMCVARIYYMMLIHEMVAYFSGTDPGVSVISLDKYLKLLEVHGNRPPTYLYLNNGWMGRDTSIMFNKYYNKRCADRYNSKYDANTAKRLTNILQNLPQLFRDITNIPGVALTGSRMTQLIAGSLATKVKDPYKNSDYDIMVLADTADQFEQLINKIREKMTGYVVKFTKTTKKIGIGYGYKASVTLPNYEPVHLDIFAVPGDPNSSNNDRGDPNSSNNDRGDPNSPDNKFAGFNRAILCFHVAPVRLYLTENQIYLLASALDCLIGNSEVVTGIRYVAGTGSTALDIIKKQYRRGFTFRMFPIHQNIIEKYLTTGSTPVHKPKSESD